MYIVFLVYNFFLKLILAHTHSLVATSVGVYLVAYQEAPAKHDGARGGGGGERGDEFEDLLELDDDLEALL